MKPTNRRAERENVCFVVIFTSVAKVNVDRKNARRNLKIVTYRSEWRIPGPVCAGLRQLWVRERT